jgi:hypothetical protein
LLLQLHTSDRNFQPGIAVPPLYTETNGEGQNVHVTTAAAMRDSDAWNSRFFGWYKRNCAKYALCIEDTEKQLSKMLCDAPEFAPEISCESFFRSIEMLELHQVRNMMAVHWLMKVMERVSTDQGFTTSQDPTTK